MVRLGLLGAGHFAKRHIAALERLNDRACLTCFARNRTEPFPEAEALGAERVPTESLLNDTDVDAVLLAVPNHLHHAYALEALEHGKHVFCEKPMALTVEDADAMIAAARATGNVLMIGHLTRYSAIYMAVAEVLASGELGAPVSAHASRRQRKAGGSWRMEPAAGGGAPLDLLVHDFDLVNWYLGPPETIMAKGDKQPEGAYQSMMVLLSRNDSLASVEGGFVLDESEPFRATLQLLCEGGRITVDTANATNPVCVTRKAREPRSLPLDGGSDPVVGVAGELEEFLDVIEGAAPRRLRLEDARTAVACAALAVQSADTHAEMRLESPLA